MVTQLLDSITKDILSHFFHSKSKDKYEALSLTEREEVVLFEETPDMAYQLLPWGHYHGDCKAYHHDKGGHFGHLSSLKDVALY